MQAVISNNEIEPPDDDCMTTNGMVWHAYPHHTTVTIPKATAKCKKWQTRDGGQFKQLTSGKWYFIIEKTLVETGKE